MMDYYLNGGDLVSSVNILLFDAGKPTPEQAEAWGQ
jgi:hypothetical protein